MSELSASDVFQSKIAVSPYNNVVNPRKHEVMIYDTTLRDGEQMPGVAFNINQKLAIAEKLAEIGIRQIEAGFPAVSKTEKHAVRAIARLGLDAEILALARITKEDIDAVLDCDVDMVLLFAATSNLHLRYKLKMTRSELLAKVVEAVEYAQSHGLKTSFSTEDSTRTELQFMKKIYCEVEKLGVVRIGLTDTLGCASPDAIEYLVKELKCTFSTQLSVHLHNDFGLATANAIRAVLAGADAIATTVNGIGERAGNLALEEIVIALKYLYNYKLDIDTTKLKSLSELVARFSRVQPAANKPWVGRNAFRHESGIHVAAILNCPATYESIPPALVGATRELILGKHSGLSAIEHRLAKRGIRVTRAQKTKILAEVKSLGEKKGAVNDKEFWDIVACYSTP